jgi:hypothetical protein
MISAPGSSPGALAWFGMPTPRSGPCSTGRPGRRPALLSFYRADEPRPPVHTICQERQARPARLRRGACAGGTCWIVDSNQGVRCFAQCISARRSRSFSVTIHCISPWLSFCNRCKLGMSRARIVGSSSGRLFMGGSPSCSAVQLYSITRLAGHSAPMNMRVTPQSSGHTPRCATPHGSGRAMRIAMAHAKRTPTPVKRCGQPCGHICGCSMACINGT